MFEQTNQKKLSPILRKILHTATIAALLLPNILPTSIAFAEDQEPKEPSDEIKTEEVAPEVEPAQVTGIHPENIVYQNGRLSLINQEPGENIAVVLPNGTLLSKTVPFHGTWEPLQNLNRYKMYPGDELEFFTYDGTVRSESIFLTVHGEGETRPADQQAIKYGWQQFSFVPTADSTYIGYKTEPFFEVEMTFPNGYVETQTANTLGQTRFQFPEDFQAKPGEVFSVRIFDRNGELLDLTNLDLFRPLTTPNQSEVRVYGDPIPEPTVYQVMIDPNGGEINEDARVTEVEAGADYTVPYTFQSGLQREGYTLTGYLVDGTLLDASGNAQIELSRYTGTYTPESDVTLTANWEVTKGTFIIQDTIPNFITETRSFALTDGENTYPLTSSSYTNSYREWRVENVPNGSYTLLVDGVPYTDEWTFDKVGHPDTQSDISMNDETTTVDLTFEDDSSTTFIRYRLGVNQYPIGVEVRNLENQRTADVDITIADENGVVFEGAYDEYHLWTTAETLLPGQYTITLQTPEGTVAEINDTASSQAAVATDEENVFTLDVSTENKGSLSRVFGAFRLVEIEEPTPETDADRYEPVFVDEIILDLNRGNGKLKNPKTFIENMNELPGKIKVEYTNLNQVDLSGQTTETQIVEITVTYRDGSTDVAEVPLTVIPKEKPTKPGKPNPGTIIEKIVKTVQTIIHIIGSLFGRWF